MMGVLWGKLDLLEKLSPYRVETNKNKPPYKFEQGTLNNAALASLQAALEYLLWLAAETAGPDQKPQDRRGAFTLALKAAANYESKLTHIVLEGFQNLDPAKIRLYGPSDLQSQFFRDPTFLFESEDRSASELKSYFWSDAGIQVAEGTHYSAAVYRHLKKPNLCRASLAHYNTVREAKIFLESLERIVK
jgi:selenocysteine lyase/cysteine desulfurase